MQRKKLNYVETAGRFQLRHKRVQDWEKIYLTYGADEFRVERRGHDSKCHSPKLEKQVEEDLIKGVQRLRAEVVYLKGFERRAKSARKTLVIRGLRQSHSFLTRVSSPL